MVTQCLNAETGTTDKAQGGHGENFKTSKTQTSQTSPRRQGKFAAGPQEESKPKSTQVPQHSKLQQQVRAKPVRLESPQRPASGKKADVPRRNASQKNA